MDEKTTLPKERPLLSIIFPNRGHFDFAQETIRNILEIDDYRFELVINDNSLPEHFDYSTFLSDRRISIYFEKEVLSMTQNWWNGLSRANGQWIAFIGADDGVVSSNFPDFLDVLTATDLSVVTSRQSVFSYALSQNLSMLQVPIKKTTRDLRVISYPFRAAAFFPQLRNTVLPIPYNGTVVKREVLEHILTDYTQIPGIAPDDYLGQYVAQNTKKGLFLDLLVFVQGTSERSNGLQVLKKISSTHRSEFESDSQNSMGPWITRFGLECFTAVALEHYYIVKEKKSQKQNTIIQKFTMYWCFITCQDKNHGHESAPRYISWFSTTLTSICTVAIRKFWIFKNFGLKTPFRYTSIELPVDSTVRTASRLLSVY
jgi:hypothetical protein